MANCPTCVLMDKIKDNVAALEKLCQEIVIKYVKKDIDGDGKPETFCNRAVKYVAAQMGCTDFKANDLANAMYDRMLEKWRQVSPEDAVYHAQHGGLAVAAKKDTPHGHVAVVYPRTMEKSPSHGIMVPIVANAGRENGIGRASQYFTYRDGGPDYFLWGRTP